MQQNVDSIILARESKFVEKTWIWSVTETCKSGSAISKEINLELETCKAIIWLFQFNC